MASLAIATCALATPLPSIKHAGVRKAIGFRISSAGVRCCATAAEGSYTQFIQLDSIGDALQKFPVFCDESQGIVCYRSATGEICCEGFDEGPHFEPSSQYKQRIRFPELLLAVKSDETLVNGAGI